jgi:hypothetical protein
MKQRGFVNTSKSLTKAAEPKVYRALLTQSGPDAPVATVLENTIGDIVWTRDSEGVYRGTLLDAFTISRTVVLIGGCFNQPEAVIQGTIDDGNSGGVIVTTYMTLTTSLLDGLLYQTPIEILVYS